MNTSKKTYVPPAKRQEAPKIADLSVTEMNDTKLFPTLKEGPKAVNKWNGSKTFKQTIDNLIATEKMSEQEKAAAEERRQANAGWVRFPTKPTPEMIHRYKNSLQKIKDDAANQEMMDYGYYRFGTYYIDGVPHYSANYIPEDDDNDTDTVINDNSSESHPEDSEEP